MYSRDGRNDMPPSAQLRLRPSIGEYEELLQFTRLCDLDLWRL